MGSGANTSSASIEHRANAVEALAHRGAHRRRIVAQSLRVRGQSAGVARKKNTALYAAVAVAALAVVAALLGVRLLAPPPPPPPAPPAPPPPPERSSTVTGRYTEGYYRTVLDEGARRFRVAAVTPV